MRQNISSGAPWETAVGYSRAVRVGNAVHVAGTTATVDGEVVGVGDPAEQTRVILGIIARALEAAGAQLSDVVRTRIYVTDISTFKDVNEAYATYFESDPPARSTIGVAALPLGAEVEIDMVVALPD